MNSKKKQTSTWRRQIDFHAKVKIRDKQRKEAEAKAAASDPA
jgi:hypothetical protein